MFRRVLDLPPPQVTREMLNDKISELNSAIDGVSQQLQSSSKESQVENM